MSSFLHMTYNSKEFNSSYDQVIPVINVHYCCKSAFMVIMSSRNELNFSEVHEGMNHSMSRAK